MISLPVPLCVDLDGSLTRTDTLVENIFLLLSRKPWMFLALPVWLLRGRAYLKGRIAAFGYFRADLLPYQQEFVQYLRAQQESGRALILVTAAPQTIARAVADHLGIFQEVIASSGTVNLAGAQKERILLDRFGKRGFDYVGNEPRDLKIWRSARRAILVNPSRGLIRRASGVTSVERVFQDPPGRFRFLLRAIRPHQWVKNILIFVPPIAAHAIRSPAVVTSAALGFIAFSACASAVYLLNDLADLSSDRQHALKRLRPLAAGDLSPVIAVALSFFLLAAAVGVCAFLPPLFALVLAVYFCLTTAYSFHCKRMVLVDVLLLAGLYTLRIIAGHAATGVRYSFWLLLFSLFFFLSLALLKRYSELLALVKEDRQAAAGRGYTVADAPTIQSLGSASAYLSVLVLALYLNTQDVTLLYRHPAYLWLILPFVLYWVSRVWILAHRNRVHEDPIVFALRDLLSYVIGILIMVIMFLAT